EEVGQYSADGIVVATPTGSTAYSLSAGGPIVVPGVDAIVVAAICPHTLAVRPLVVPSHAEVAVEPIPPWTEDVLVSFDGQVGTTMQPGDRLVVKRANRPVVLVRLGPDGFFARMREKLQWGDLSDRAQVVLTELRVRDLAVIAAVTLPLVPGLNVLTGETGAGKSMPLASLSSRPA